MEISKRQATQGDYKWLFELKVASMRDYVDEVYGWDDDVQKEYFDRDFCAKGITIITVDGIDAGMFEILSDSSGFFIKRIEIHPTYQGKGIGSKIVNELLSQASAKGDEAWLMVFKINPAYKLYKRIGFEIVEETETHYKMVKQNKNLQRTCGR